ncbi:MAG: acetate--CoA ligase family protein [Comamonadaceae bacterium]|nr:acetate--CoA ligase family protein [Comamonadaceae bacterium]
MLDAVAPRAAGGAHQRHHRAADGQPQRARQDARGLRRPDHRRPVRPGHHLRRRRHDDRADRRPRDGAAAAEPVPGAAADRALARRRACWANGAARRRPTSQALEQLLLRVSEMVCALPQLREMDINPDHRRRDRRGGGGRAHRHRRTRSQAAGQLQPPGDPALPGEPGTRVADEGRRPLHDPPDPPRRRRHAAGLRARAVARRAATSASPARCRSCRRACWRATR